MDTIPSGVQAQGIEGSSIAFIYKVIQKLSAQLYHFPDNPRFATDVLVLGPVTALNRSLTLVASVDNFTQEVSQPTVSQQSTVSQLSCLACRSKQLQEQDFPVEQIAASQRPSTRASTNQSCPYLKSSTEIIRWTSHLL